MVSVALAELCAASKEISRGFATPKVVDLTSPEKLPPRQQFVAQKSRMSQLM